MKLDSLVKSQKTPFPSFRLNETCPGENREPESSKIRQLESFWTPVTLSRRKPGTGVTTFFETVKLCKVSCSINLAAPAASG